MRGCHHIQLPGYVIRIDEARITVYKLKGHMPLVYKRIYHRRPA